MPSCAGYRSALARRVGALCFAAQVHVRLEAFKTRGLLEDGEALVLGDGVRRDIQLSAGLAAKVGQNRTFGRLLSLGIEPQAELYARADLLADRVQVQVPGNL